MYYSEVSDEYQYRWSQPRPKIKSNKPDIFCNDRPCKSRNWRESRESMSNMAFKWSRSTDFILSSLGDNFLIIKGCISMPDKEIGDWRTFKNIFNRYRRRWEQATGYAMAIVAKQHITIKRGKVKEFKDDMHYDYVAYTDAPLSVDDVRELILSWVHKSGGNRKRSACKPIEDRSSDNLQRLCDYNFKSPNTKAVKDKYMKFAPLASTRLPVTWVMGDFWRCKTQIVEATVYWNDELITKERKLSPMDQVWLQWIKSVCGDEIPRFTTEDHRNKVMADRLAEAEFSWDVFLNSCPDFESDGQNHPIIYTVRNSDISPSENPIQISENTANNGTNLAFIEVTLKNTLHIFKDTLKLPTTEELKAYEICFPGYSLQPTDDGRYSLRIGKVGQMRDPDSILGDGFHRLDGEFRLDQVRRIVTSLGHVFHDEDQWKETSIVKAPIQQGIREEQRRRAKPSKLCPAPRVGMLKGDSPNNQGDSRPLVEITAGQPPDPRKRPSDALGDDSRFTCHSDSKSL